MNEARDSNGLTLKEFLHSYDESKFRHPSVTVDIVVFTMDFSKAPKLKTLLIKRKNHPNIGKWALPGGFVDFHEPLETAAARELEEETGLTGIPLFQCGAYGGPDRDPRTRVITIAYYSLAPKQQLNIKAGDDAADAELFTLDVQLKANSSGGKIYKLTLKGSTELNAAIGMHEGIAPRPYLIDGGELSTDHALILFNALYAMKNLKTLDAAEMIAGRDTVNKILAYRKLKQLMD